MTAGDTFVRDWVLQGERDVPAMTKSLGEIRTRYRIFIRFFVSEAIRNAYHPDGVRRRVEQGSERDAGYFRSRDLDAANEIKFDADTASADTPTVSVDQRAFDHGGKTVGVTGVGRTVGTVRRLRSGYPQRPRRGVHCVARSGAVVLYGDQPSCVTLRIGQVEGLGDTTHRVLARDSGSYPYRVGGEGDLLNVRYVPELDGCLFVDQVENEAQADIRRTL